MTNYIKINRIKKIKSEPTNFYDITVEDYHNFSIGNSKIIVHNSSLTKAINKLAKTFGCSRTVLQGDGFFGSPVNPKPASSRYTKIKSDPVIKELITRYGPLNRKNSEGNYDWLYVDIPISLATHIVGIAVGYSSNILPRKMDDVVSYLNGADKPLKPFFMGFGGAVKKYNGLDNGWLIEGVFEADDDKMSMRIGDLPPVVKYTSFLNKLNDKLTLYGDHCKLINDSKKVVDITIKWTDRDSYKEVKAAVEKLTKTVVIENIIFVKDGAVMEYSNIHDYLDEFRVHRERIFHMKMLHDLQVSNGELEFLLAKREFLLFMMEKKRKSDEIKKFMDKYRRDIRDRLDGIKLTALSPETVKLVDAQITDIRKEIEERKGCADRQLKKCQALEKKFVPKGKVNLSSATGVFEDTDQYQINGIDVYNAVVEDVDPSENVSEEEDDNDED